MQGENKLTPTSFKLPLELKERLRDAVHVRRTTYTAAAKEAFEAWLGQRVPTAKTERSAPPLNAGRFALEQALLQEILEHGTPADAEWIRGNLKNFVEAIRSRAANPPQSRESPRKQKMAR